MLPIATREKHVKNNRGRAQVESQAETFPRRGPDLGHVIQESNAERGR